MVLHHRVLAFWLSIIVHAITACSCHAGRPCLRPTCKAILAAGCCFSAKERQPMRLQVGPVMPCNCAVNHVCRGLLYRVIEPPNWRTSTNEGIKVANREHVHDTAKLSCKITVEV